MKVSLKTAFSILDGRLSTNIEDVYKMLSYIFDTEFITSQLPTAMNKLKEINPDWFKNGVSVINDIKNSNNTDSFKELMELIDKVFPTYEIELGKVEYKIDFLSGLVQVLYNTKIKCRFNVLTVIKK